MVPVPSLAAMDEGVLGQEPQAIASRWCALDDCIRNSKLFGFCLLPSPDKACRGNIDISPSFEKLIGYARGRSLAWKTATLPGKHVDTPL